MWYHAVGYYGSRKRYWWNRKKDDLLEDVLLPFVGHQVRLSTRAGEKSVFNFGGLEYITILETEKKLVRPENGQIPSDLERPEFIKRHNITESFANELKVLSSHPAVRSLLQRSFTTPSKRIFVVMRIGDRLLDSAYRGVMRPIGEEFGYGVVRVDEIQDSGSISDQILENIAQSEIVLADLSGERPNCYYEAGFAHALGKQLIFTIHESSTIHFDLQGYRFIKWGTEEELRNALRERLDAIVSKGAK